MLKKIINIIPKLAKEAVFKAEENLKTESGKTKKSEAIKFVIENLPVSKYLKGFLGTIMSVFIDSAIEIAVAFMNMDKSSDCGNEVQRNG